ncbi:MAG: bifunctional nuclease family protein [Candidatus Hydrogenedentes bacterium]|nr:bifunctional nuclease family protein [Candidatus Hydrogenedentota bacterium]
MVEVSVVGITLDGQNQPVVILRADDRVLPIWIGTTEAFAIQSALKKAPMKRPLTHDLIVYILQGFNAVARHVHIYKLEEQTYYANLVLVQKDETGADRQVTKIDCRPSDAIAIAVRMGCPVFVDEEVLRIGGHDASLLEGGDEQEDDTQNGFD